MQRLQVRPEATLSLENKRTGKMSTYHQFLEQKRHTSQACGIATQWLPSGMFPFQQHVADQSIRKGRAAGFLGTGLGKTIIQLSIATNYVQHTNKPALILTPLAVAGQFIEEAEKFGIEDVAQTRDGSFRSKIVLCNYERLHHLDPSAFDCVLLDESSILKNDEGKTRKAVTQFLRKTPYRYLFTATPSPNDYIELGTSSEALGHMGFADMVSRFFRNSKGSVDLNSSSNSDFYLKPHAERDFWRWISTWAISLQKPSDIGFSDDGYNLPPLHEIDHIVRNETPLAIGGQHSLFALPAKSWRETKAEVKTTIGQRCGLAVDLAKAHDTSIYWTNLNAEAEAIMATDNNAHEIKGTMSIDEKEALLMAFSHGEIKKLVTKPSITAFGLNWQHCGHATVFPTDSYEQYFQLVRRCWRFGRHDDVTIDRIYSDGQVKTMLNQVQKHKKAVQLYANLVQQSNQPFNMQTAGFDKNLVLPNFIHS
jgi:hypothetical protein